MSVESVYRSMSDASMTSVPEIEMSQQDERTITEEPASSKVSDSDPSTSQRVKVLKVNRRNEEFSNQYDFSNFKFPDESKGQVLYDDTASCSYNESELSQSCPRQEVLYMEQGKHVQSNGGNEDDDFFEVTIDDVRKMMADLKHGREEHDSKELLTEELRKTRKLERASKYPKVMIRLVFPSRHILQAVFNPLETIKELYALVQEYVAKPFYLFTTPPKTMLKDQSVTLFDAGFAPAARVYVSSDDLTGELLKESSLRLVQDSAAANLCLASVFKIPKQAMMSSKCKEEKLKKFLKIGPKR
uniref:UBX domain-containing protein n=1 Tax=Ciona savignyi TaxID=51511 RepID=H2Z5Z9_CIOSA